MAQIVLTLPDNQVAFYQHLAEKFGFNSVSRIEGLAKAVPYQAFWDKYAELKLAATEKLYFPENPEAAGALLDTLLCEPIEPNYEARIVRDPEKLGGKPIIRGFRVRVIDVLDQFALATPVHEILEDYPMLEYADLVAVARWVQIKY